MLIAGNDSKLIGKLKERLFKSFDMKDLGPAKQMLGMRITRDRKAKKLWLCEAPPPGPLRRGVITLTHRLSP